MNLYSFKNNHGKFTVCVGDKIELEDGQQFEVDVILPPVTSTDGIAEDRPKMMRRTGENSYVMIEKDKVVDVFGNEHTITDSPCPQCGGDLHLDSVEDQSEVYGEECGHAKIYNLSCPNCGMSFDVREATMAERIDHYNYNHKDKVYEV